MNETAEAKLARVVGEFIQRHKVRGAEIAGFGELYEASIAHEVDMLQRARLHVIASEQTEDLAGVAK